MGTTGLGADHPGDVQHDRQHTDSEDEAIAGHDFPSNLNSASVV